MPFISEELYQKLPYWESKYESICIAPYPTGNNWKLDFKAIQDEFEIANAVAKTIRSLKSSFEIPLSIKPAIYALPSSDTERAIIERNQDLITTLGRSSKVLIILTL